MFSLLFLTPLTSLDSLTASLMEETVFCVALTFIATLASSSIILSTLLIGLDQYLAIVDPLHYHSRLSRKRVTLLCALVWFLSIAASVLVISDPETTITYFTWSHTCTPKPHLHPYSGYRLVVCLSVVVIVYFLPFTLITFTYLRIFTAARGNSVRTRRNSISSLRRNSVTSTHGRSVLSASQSPRKLSFTRSPSIRSTGHQLLADFTSLRASMKSRLSNASTLFLYKVTILET